MGVPCTAEDLYPISLGSLGDTDRVRLAAHCEIVDATTGDELIHEGDVDRALFFLLEGTARILRGDVSIGVATPGGYFGELGLILGRPRAATVVAASRLRAARLDHARYRALVAEHPDLAFRLVEALVGGIADRLHEMTASVGVLLHDRSFPRHVQIDVQLGGEVVRVRTGTPVGAVLPARLDGQLVVGGLVDRRAAPASWPITSSCLIEPLTAAHPEGERLLRASTALLLLEAFDQIAPGVGVSMGHSVGLGQRVELARDPGFPLDTLAAAVEARMRELCAAGAQLREEQWTTEEARDHFRDRGWDAAVALLDTWTDRTVTMCSYGRVHAIALAPLAANASLVAGFRLIPDGVDGLVLIYPSEAAGEVEVQPMAVEAAVRSIVHHTRALSGPHDRWLRALGVTSVGAFNRACVCGQVAPIIRVAEGFHEKRVSEIADQVRLRGRGARIICIAGPSSSGKTTFIQRLKVQLQVVGLEPVEISLDHYYVDRDRSPRDAYGELDYEALEALRLDLLGLHVAALLDGEPVRTARYDFATGLSEPDGGGELALADDQVLMIEGIHALNPRLLPTLPRDQVFSVFVCPLAQLPFDRLSRVHASDVRLIRRIVRDRHGRDADAAATIRRWPAVRGGERRHIFPFQHLADAVVDTSLVYELSVLKVFAQRYLLEVPRGDVAWTTAARLLGLLDRFVTIYPEQVPPTSILMEFIRSGGGV
jgi:uridine kinase